MGRPVRTVRRAATVAVIAAILCGVAAASAGAAPPAFVSNDNSGSVSVIDTATNHVLGKPIPVGEAPSALAITPNGSSVYVDNGDSGTVTVIDSASRVPVATIPVGLDPEGIAISPDGKTVYVADLESEEVSVIETSSNHVVRSIPVGFKPSAIAVAPNGQFAYVVGGKDSLAVIDTQTGAVSTPTEVGEGPVNLTFSPDGKTAYVVDHKSGEVSVINTTIGQAVGSIPVGGEPNGIAVTPNGRQLFVSNGKNDVVTVVSTQNNQIVGVPIPTGEEPAEIAITPSGATAYVANAGSDNVTAIDTATDQVVGTPIAVLAVSPLGIAITPDQSPTAAFNAPTATALTPTTFEGGASTDPDGTIASYSWSFGDGATASGVNASHTYSLPGTYNASLSVVDNEGCGAEEVFTGRTAYCSGGASTVTHPVTVAAPAVVHSSKFRFGRLIHNLRNGTARLQVKLPGPGSILLFGMKVHAVTRKVKAAGSMFLTLHARVEVNKRLKKVHRIKVPIRVTFSPTGGTPRTLHRSVTLLRKKKHHHR